MTNKVNKEILRIFITELKALGAKGAKVADQTSYNDLVDAYIEALFTTLKGVILTRLRLEGRAKSPDRMSPKEAIESMEQICHEILSMIGDDLSTVDSKHEYSVGILKKEKGK